MKTLIKYDITTETSEYSNRTGRQTYGMKLSEYILGDWRYVMKFSGVSDDRKLMEHLQKNFNREQLPLEEFVKAMGEIIGMGWRKVI